MQKVINPYPRGSVMQAAWEKLAGQLARQKGNRLPHNDTYTSSNGNASETKANESFDNGVFFDIEAKWTAL